MAREMKDSGVQWIGEMPIEWSISKLKYLGCFVNGYAFKPEDWGDEGLPIIRIQDLTGSNDNPNHFNGKIDTKYLINKGDILVSWAATLDAFLWKKDEAWLNQHIFKAIPDVSKVDYVFFFWLIKETMKNMNNDNKHGIFMQHVTLDLFENYTIPLPPLNEQHHIASFLDSKCAEIDKAIEATKASIEEYRKLRQAIITEAVTAEDIPRQKFKYFATVKANLVHPEDYPEMYQVAPDNIEKDTGRLLFDTVKSVKDCGVISDNHLFHKGQILYSKIRPILNKVTIAPFDGLCCADMYPIETNNNTKYLVYSMLSADFLRQVKAITEERVKMPKINQEELGGIIIGVPSISKQEEIVEVLDSKCSEIDFLIKSKEKLIEELTAYRKSLIYEYVTGKKEVPIESA